MAKCNKCGTTYYTKECLKCKAKEYQYNKDDFNYRKIESKNSLLKTLLIFLFIIAIIAGAVAIFRIIELEEHNTENIKTINKLRADNEIVKRRNNLNDRLVTSYKKQNRELQHKLRYCKNNSNGNNNYKNVVKYTKAKKTTPKQKNRNNTYVKKIYSNTNYKNTVQKKAQTSRKKYQRYTGNLKLVSDSEITRGQDNRLHSNSSIYGRYYGYSQHNIQCDKEENLYNVVDDCSMYLGLITDKVYFSKSRKNSIKKYNRKDHMLECDYSEEYGIFHDCKVKIYKY